MGFWKNAALVAAGYGLSELSHGGKEKDDSENKQTLEDIILEYAHAHDIWGRDEHFYRTLLKIADQFHDPYAIGDD